MEKNTTVIEQTEVSQEEERTDTISTSNGKIEMPYSSVFYEGSEWTLESLTEHFRELGFTSFENIPCEPDDEDYDSNIYAIEICTGWFSEYYKMLYVETTGSKLRMGETLILQRFSCFCFVVDFACTCTLEENLCCNPWTRHLRENIGKAGDSLMRSNHGDNNFQYCQHI